MIQLSVMTSFGWWDDGVLGPRDLLARLAAHGAQGVEVLDADFYQNPAFARDYPRWLAEHNLRLIALDVICNLVHKGAPDRRRAQDELRRGLDVCAEHGASVAHCAGSHLIEGVTPADGRKMIADLLGEAYDLYTRKYGVVLAIENYGLAPDLICRKTDCLEVLDRAGDRVKLVFDTGNFLAVGERAEENLADCYNRIAMCHFKDWTPASRPATPEAPAVFENSRLGEGVIRNARIADMLLERGYDGWVSLESCRHDGETVDATLARELALLRRWFRLPSAP
jgi:sugar phosphate isomerase/epimerase